VLLGDVKLAEKKAGSGKLNTKKNKEENLSVAVSLRSSHFSSPYYDQGGFSGTPVFRRFCCGFPAMAQVYSQAEN
jgi:hypothetical protein